MKKGSEKSFWGRMWDLFYPILIYEGVSMVVGFVFDLIMIFLHREECLEFMNGMDYVGLSSFLSDCYFEYYLQLYAVIVLISVPIFLLLIRRDRRVENTPRYEKVSPLFYFLTMLLGLAVCVVVNHLLIFSKLAYLLSEGYESVAGVLYQGNFALELVTVAVLVPISEELLFRGLIYRRIRSYAGVGTAIFSSALYFAFYHGNLLQGIYAFILGVLFAYVYERFQNLLAPIAMHIGSNVMSVLISETQLFDKVYEDELVFIIVTVIFMVAFLGLVYGLDSFVRPKPFPQVQPVDTGNDPEKESGIQ